jgi:radical SAM superfamily enzyme YgiQ (UPF0313 family)
MIIQGEGEAVAVETLCSIWNIEKPRLFDTADLDAFPYPAFDLTSSPYVCIMTSRGCPYRCTYCASKILNKGFRRRNPVMVAEEIGFWNSKGIRDFAFYDDALLYEPELTAIPSWKKL